MPAVGPVIFVTSRISIIHAEEPALALEFEDNLVARGGYRVAIVIEDLNFVMHDVSTIGRDDVAIDRHRDCRRFTGGTHFQRRCDLSVPVAYGFEGALFIGNVPGQVQVRGRSQNLRALRQVGPSQFHAQPGELVSFHPQRPAVEK